jgi:EAL and modified HD-GYP domain-containing signal transduction protein
MTADNSTCSVQENIFVARQPIFDRSEKIWGYELLHRESETAMVANISDGDVATQAVIADGVSLAMEGLTGKHQRILINFPQNLLVAGAALALPKDTCVVEILEDVRPTPEVLDALRELKKAGYTLAMDDFCGETCLLPFLDLVDIVKVDILGLDSDPDKIRAVHSVAVRHTATLLAEKVEDRETYDLLRDMGFDLFQGFFFSKPQIVPGKKLSSSQMSKLQLLRELGKDDFELREIANILKADPSLSFRLFRHINSAGFGLNSKVDTLDRAVVIMGQRPIAQWLRTALMSDLNSSSNAGELVFLSVQRAKFLEMLAMHAGMTKNVHPDSFFVVGLFSLLDSMLGMRMKDLLKTLPLDEIITCTLDGSCPEHTLLKLAHSYERGYWADTDKRIREMNLDRRTVDALYVEARNWAQRALAA